MALFEESDQSLAVRPKRRRQKAAATPDSGVARCISLFYDEHVRKWSAPSDVKAWETDPNSVPKGRLVTPKINGGKHGRKFKELIASWGEDVVLDLVRRFFSTTDPKITCGDYSLDTFFMRADHMRIQSVRRRFTDERLLGNMDAAARASGLKP